MSRAEASTAFIVTTSVQGRARSQVWDSSHPLPIGHPFRWVMERTERGVRIRDLGSTSRVKELGESELAGGEVRLDGEGVREAITLSIRPARRLEPAYRARTGQRQADPVAVFACAGDWLRSSETVSDRYTARFGRRGVFTLRRNGDRYSLDIHSPGVRLEIEGEPAQEPAAGQAVHLERAQLGDACVKLGGLSWRFGFVRDVALPDASALKPDADALWFRKALQGAAAGLALFSLIAWLWPAPKPDTQELVPAQFAKIVLAKPKPEKAASASGSSSAGRTEVAKKVQNAAVVQAFRAKALQSAVNGLLKGGMTKLLQQSDFVAGSVASAEARRIFDTRSEALKATGPVTGDVSGRNVAVNSIGGNGAGGKGGKGVGYGQGERAGVKGQGQAFVSMDIAGAAVDEGLTKDEVGEVIHRHLSEIRYCYESAMIRSPDIEGKLMVNFTIGGNGMVKSTEVKSSTLPDPRLDDCILRRLTTWKFPNPRGGVDVAVSYPFIFKTLGR